MAQIQQLDSSLERAIEAYNLANVKLNRIKHDLNDNTHALAVAKKSLMHAQKQLSARLVDIYTSGDQNAGLAVLLGASSLDDMLGRMDASDRVSEQDSLVLKQVAHFRREVQHRQQFLQHAHAEQVQVVAERNAARPRSSRSSASASSCSARSRARSRTCRRSRPRGRPRSSARSSSSSRRSRRRSGRPRSRRRSRSARPRRPHRPPSPRRPRTAASSGSRCSTSGRRTSGAAPRRPASTAPAS